MNYLFRMPYFSRVISHMEYSISLKDRAPIKVDAEKLIASDALKLLGIKGLDKVVAVRINGESRDLVSQVENGSELEPVYLESDEGLEILRHSTSHVMAMAVREIFPGVKVTIGPAIDNGFYYDFDTDRPFKVDDLPLIEEKMKQIIKENHSFNRVEMSKDEAVDLFKSEGENYKVEIIEDLGDERISLYTQGSFTDLCRGPHIPATGRIKAFKLTKVAGAYWRGDEKRPMLSRVYGVAFTEKNLY